MHAAVLNLAMALLVGSTLAPQTQAQPAKGSTKPVVKVPVSAKTNFLDQSGSRNLVQSASKNNVQSNLKDPQGSGAQKAAPPDAKSVDACLINQNLKIFGEQQLLISKIGIKSFNPRSQISLVMTPPYQSVTLYNKLNQGIIQMPVKSLRCPVQKTFALFNNWMLGDSPMQKIGSGEINGFKVVKYRTTKAFTATQLMLRKTEKVPSSNPTVIDLQTTEDFQLPAGVGMALAKFYGVPDVPGIPLQVDLKDTDDNPSNYLRSSKCRKTRASAGDFALPTGYRKLKSVEEINQSNETEDAMQLFGR
jgi:hypothetical protein